LRKAVDEMIDFVYGTDQQYEGLKVMLNDHLCHVFNNCSFPACCSRTSGRMGFEKEGDTYALYIDKGIVCSNANAPQLFRDWLGEGTLRFLDFTDLKEFLRSLHCLY